MADDTNSGNRATVAGVDAKVAGIGEAVEGLKELTRAEVRAIRDDLQQVTGLPVAVARLEVGMADHERRVLALESEENADEQRRRARRDRIFLTLVSVLISGGGSFLFSHIHIP